MTDTRKAKIDNIADDIPLQDVHLRQQQCETGRRRLGLDLWRYPSGW